MIRPFPGSARWFTIPAHRPFLSDLARTLYQSLGADSPERLADAVVLTPTRRGARSLAEAFVSASEGGALLLPQILALGDLDEGEPPFEPGDLALDLPPAITPSRRRLELAQLISRHESLFDRRLDAAACLELGDALGAFLDAIQMEELNPSPLLNGLVEEDLAAHWRRSADVLRLATDAWPAHLRRLGLLDVTERRTLLLRALASQWADRPPNSPLIAAGSTGGAAATADLLAVIAAAPQGMVVLPGLDLDLAEDAWTQIGEAHPQCSMKRLLERSEIDRSAVAVWPADEPHAARRRGRARRRLINEALRPPDATADWLRIIDNLRAEGGPGDEDPIAGGAEGLSLVVARNEEEAATAAAVLLRESLEVSEKTAALITPDAAMARRVSARLARWGVEADSSGGRALTTYPQGVFLALTAQAFGAPLDAAARLALLKHPLARWGLTPSRAAAAAVTLEREALRGPAPKSWTTLTERLHAVLERKRADADPSAVGRRLELEAAIELAARVREIMETLSAVGSDPTGVSLAAAAKAIAATMEAMARDQTGDVGDLWSGPGGDAAAEFLAGLLEDGASFEALTSFEATSLIQRLLAEQLVRTGGAHHPRLRILGALEARLVSADRFILAGLEEGVWPRPPPVDPFLSRPMRAQLGLPSPERRIGLSAHDFAQAVCAPEVVLIATERRDGQPAVKSRWLWRLETLLGGAGVRIPRRADVEAWVQGLDAPITPRPPALRSAERPAPRPPLEARPRRLPVTRVETWVRDPYAVYAREILKLRRLERPDAAMEASQRGTALHRAFQLFADAHDMGPLFQGQRLFAELAIESLTAAGFSPAALVRERTLALRLGAWASDFERDRRPRLDRLAVEVEGAYSFEVDGRPFTLTAKADRIELAGGVAHVIDFKTGQAPTPEQVKAGFYPQLTLTAAILRRGGFSDLGRAEPGDLLYVRAIGRRIVGEIRPGVRPEHSSLELVEEAFDGLIRRIARFDDPATPYLPWAAPQFLAQRAGDYDHLSRLYEWHVMADGDTDGAVEE